MFHALIMEFVLTQLVNVNVMLVGKDKHAMYLFVLEIVFGMEQLVNAYKDGLEADAMNEQINVKMSHALDMENVIKLTENVFAQQVGMAINAKHQFAEEIVNGMVFNVFANKVGLE